MNTRPYTAELAEFAENPFFSVNSAVSAVVVS
jgi:hypothetical protein